jgi:hypothetical protein
MFGNAQMGGINLGFPDVCLTPPAEEPIPYPNLGLGPMGVPAAYNVLFECTPAHNLETEIPISLLDEPGIELGVASGEVMGPVRHVTAAYTCLVDGVPVTRLTSISIQNSTNCPGMRIVPSQFKVLVLAP